MDMSYLNYLKKRYLIDQQKKTIRIPEVVDQQDFSKTFLTFSTIFNISKKDHRVVKTSGKAYNLHCRGAHNIEKLWHLNQAC